MKSSRFHDARYQKKELRDSITRNFGPDDSKKILAALRFAQLAHKGQRRDEGSAYIIHPVRVALILVELVGTWDADMVVAALLHDVVEDCGVRLATIQKRFGRRVAIFVRALTRKVVERETEAEKERHKIEKLDILRRAPLEVRLIKCADFLDNIRCAAEVSFYAAERRKFARWHREFHHALKFAREVHAELAKEISHELRKFDVKRFARTVVRLGR
ncbi:bifunctional (p)ppGpp synthetase/guanosine-3',5'-bis(diphosphate) 3'-pyrophosphohydrolase [Candidatus Uhrbacteria bacterium]|nr:bifunctional (p)ppGpp synthetase/guanosine-3',5'-bis(diphosphate) 3'-pyrophosphohydrolase [Candidatus Uhrbacteria bacterium]